MLHDSNWLVQEYDQSNDLAVVNIRPVIRVGTWLRANLRFPYYTKFYFTLPRRLNHKLESSIWDRLYGKSSGLIKGKLFLHPAKNFCQIIAALPAFVLGYMKDFSASEAVGRNGMVSKISLFWHRIDYERRADEDESTRNAGLWCKYYDCNSLTFQVARSDNPLYCQWAARQRSHFHTLFHIRERRNSVQQPGEGSGFGALPKRK